MYASEAPLLTVNGLCKEYRQTGRRVVRAVDNVSFTLKKGEVLGVVGESGCGKSTLGRALLRLVEPGAGTVQYQGQDLLSLKPGELKKIRKHLQIIFQDPFASLNPRHRIGTILAEPLKVHSVGDSTEQRSRVAELLAMVGLPEDSVKRFPHEFSGGQRQRIAIARALALNPELLIADEAVSALDVSVQSQIINLINRLQRQLGLAILFISHDISVIRHVSDRVAVMYLGRIVELGDADVVLDNPQHPYTQALLSAVPDPTRGIEERILLEGEIPDPSNPPRGCSFNTRCPLLKAQAPPSVRQQCLTLTPELLLRQANGDNVKSRELACHLYDSI